MNVLHVHLLLTGISICLVYRKPMVIYRGILDCTFALMDYDETLLTPATRYPISAAFQKKIVFSYNSRLALLQRFENGNC